MTLLRLFVLLSDARQKSGQWFSVCLIISFLSLNLMSLAEGTKQLEPVGAPSNSVCKLVLSQSTAEFRIPFALLNCKEEFRLNIHIKDFANEKIYFGFGEIINYSYDNIIYTDVKYQVKDPNGVIVPGYSLRQMPQVPGDAGFISTRDQVDAGPDINNTNTGGYEPLVINPGMNGDYIIEFLIPVNPVGSSVISEMRVLRYFDATVANGNDPIAGRLWSKAWQLATRSVDANTMASYSKLFIYTNDSIVTCFDCNGLAGGVWSIYSNEWGSSVTGAWTARRQSRRGNASVEPEYKIFLNDPDSAVFPSGHIGEMLDFSQIPNDCDTVLTFAATVTKGGNIDVLMDVPPFNPKSIGPEDVILTYNVKAGYNILKPSWDGKDGYGVPVENGTVVSSRISFLNGLSNVPLYDVEDNPKGFKVDIQRPKPVSGSTRLKLFWDDMKLPSRYFPSSNVTEGCLYSGVEPLSGCHAWSRFLPVGDTISISLGDTNTVNTWWYLTTDQKMEMSIQLKNRPSSGKITGPSNICKGQIMNFETQSIPFAKSYVWDVSGPGLSYNSTTVSPDTTFTYSLNKAIFPGDYLVSVFGRNPVCGDGKTVKKLIKIHDLPIAGFTFGNPCQGAGITFADHSIAADAILNEFTWIVKSPQGNERIFHGNPSVIVFDTTINYNVGLIVKDLLGCIDTAYSEVVIGPKPNCAFEIIENPNVNNGELHFNNQTTGATEYSWNFGNNTSSALAEPVVKYDLEGDYTIMLVASNIQGCKDTTTRKYYFMPGLWLPNAFSPDNNGHNDFFKPVTERTSLDPYQLCVFDRWGQLIFKSTNPAEGWDGKYDGKPCPAGSYSYFIQYSESEIESSKIITLRGLVSLIR